MSATLVDPLSEVSRKERRMLLGLSMLGVFFTHGGALPKKFTTLGVELSAGEQKAFLIIFAVGLLYFLSAFFIYAISDFIVWRRKIMEEYIENATQAINDFRYSSQAQDQHDAHLEHEKEEAWREYRVWAKLKKPTSLLRALFEFALPIAAGLYSIATILLHTYPRT